MSKEVSFTDIDTFRKDLAEHPASAALARAVQNVGPYAASRDTLGKAAMAPVFSDEIDTGAVTNQKKSGRCWLFAELNTMRHFSSDKFGIKDLEFSQAYNAFYDRLEKSNLFLEHVIATADKPLTDREVADLLAAPNGDGGQYDNAAGLIAKYGLVPKSVMPETFNSSQTNEINASLELKLRKDAVELRQARAEGADEDQLRATKVDQLSTIYRMLAYAYGEPTKKFDFEYRDKDKQYHIDRDLTPQSFYKKYVGFDFDDYVTLASTNAPGKKYYQTYTIPAQNTVIEGQPVKAVNVPHDVFTELAVKQIQAGTTVWFGNDVLADMDRKSGTLEGGLYDLNGLFDVDFTMDKGERFATRQAEVSHAMVLTGVDLVDGTPRRWKVENSWGKDNGHDGYFVADAKWFDDYVYEVVIKKSLLPADVLAALDKEPIALPAWDPLA
ncbi:C1 family peptidase [Lacticaseibacillus zhaodongensis]|uniref:C1 family peptidase n=1 Tax=Lacticaseibacillus zhaodongensis TaxID=2668065 RepID=UPI0012D31F86|nr:C1 family peptidase [Lacticaseibacillus zhaodongensis]